MPKAMPPARKQPGEGRDIVSRGYFTTFGGVRRGEFARGEYPRRGASANPSNSGGFWGVGGAQGKRAGDYPPPGHSQARRGAFFALLAGSGSPPSHWGEGAASPTAKKPNRTAAHNSHSAPSSRGAASPPPASAWSDYLTGRPARLRTGAAGEGGAGDIMVLH